jgi:hypothetical protein
MRFGNMNPSTLSKLAAIALVFGLLLSSTAEAKRRRRSAARYAPSAAAYGCGSNPYAAAGNQANAVFNGGVDRHVDPRLVKDAQTVATTASLKSFNGGQVVITSGYRDCYRNAHTPGSAKNSAHLRGHAIDIRSKMGSPISYASAIQSQLISRGATTAKGGYYNSCIAHVHLDIEHKGFANECGGRGNFRRAKATRRHRRKH